MLTVRNLTKTYPARHDSAAVRALRGVSFDIADGDFFALLGPSGCGKTTMLQCIAGLEVPDSGEITMADDAVYASARGLNVPANRRQLGMVFQSYAIWPHMTVFDNVAFPLAHGAQKIGKAEIDERVRRVLDLVKLGAFADRLAPHLSGGQQQRVALARALVHEPRLLLLDEPLSNLDAKLRDAMRIELRQLVKSLGITTLFVTHDQVEAMGMSDKLALMRDGVIVQQGTPHDIYMRPETAFAADFMGRSNLIPGRVSGSDGMLSVETSIGTIRCPAPAEGLPEGILVIRPQAIRLHGPSIDGLNCFAGRVERISFLGDVVEGEVRVGAGSVKVVIDPYRLLAMNQEITVELPPERCVLVPAEGGTTT